MKRKHFICAFMALLSCFVFSANAQVAKIGEQTYTTLADALTAARDGETVSLLWKEGQAPIAMNGSVFGKNVTIKGTANVDWSKGFLFVGRGGEGNATVTFDGANLTSASNSASYGIHVSGREKNTNNKYDGTLVIKNSTIELDYLINKGAMTIDKATLTVKNGFATGGRPATETESGEDATATISLTNESKLVVNNHNGMGLGYEAIGVMNIDATSAFETTQSFLVTAKGKMNIAGKAIVTGTLTNQGAINLTSENATLKAQEGLTVNSTIDGRDVIYADGYYTVKNDPTTLYIANLGDLKAFRDAVNSGKNYYKGVTVYLTADIDMSGENWVGIGTTAADHGFMGNFDGQGYKIKNLTITYPALDSDGYAYAGLFGVTEGTDKDNQNTIKNLTIENVTITTTGHIASAAIAYPYYTIVDKVKVCGDIKIQGGNYTAGVLAYTRRCVNASNLSIVGNKGSFVKGNQTIGGVISDIQMNGGLTAVYSNFSAEGITVTGEKSVGGIAGIIATQTLNGATVKNVTLNSTDDFAGVVAGRLGGTSTISNVVSENVTGATAVIGATYDGAKAVEARIGNMYYATFADAYAAAKAGETVSMLADLNMSEILVLDKAITLDGNGKTLTSTAGRAINVSGAEANGVKIQNLTIDAKGERAINVIQNATNVTIENVTATAANYTVNVAPSAPNAKVAINNSSLTGLNVVNVASPGADVTITNATITCNDQNASENYAALALNKDAVGAKIAATNVTFDIKGDSKKASNGAVDGVIIIDDNTDEVDVVVAYIKSESDYYYAYTSIEAAIEAAKAGETIVLLRDMTVAEKITISASVVIDGNGKTITYTGSDRAIDVPANADAKVNVTIENLTVDCTASYCQRGINYNDDGALKLNNVTVKGTNVTYALNLPGSSDKCEVAINNSSLTGNIALNVWGENSVITATNSEFVSVDKSTAEGYVAISLNNDGAGNAATGSVVTINGGKIIARDDKGEPSTAVRVETVATVNVSEETEVVGSIKRDVAIVTYEGSTDFYSFDNLQSAINKAIESKGTVVLLADVTIDELVKIEKDITIDLNGKKVTSTAKKAFEVYANTTIKNGTIEAAQRCVDTRKAVKLTLENVNLVADNYTTAYGNPQPLTIGGSENGTEVTMTNVNISAAAGYGIITFVETELTAANSTIGGYSALYVKPGSDNSVFNFVDSDLSGSTVGNDVEGNSFSVIAVRANNVTVNVVDASTVTAAGNYSYAISFKSSYQNEVATGSSVTVAGEITGNILADLNGNTVKVKAKYADKLAAAGYATIEAENGLVAVIEAVAKIGGTYYATFENAYKAAQEGETITMLAPVVIASGETLTLDKNVTVACTSNVAGEDMFTNRGTLNISAGTITYANTDATASNVTVSTISSEPGSVLNITGGTVENKTIKADGSSIYSYAIDMLTNGNLGDVTATIAGGKVYSDYMAIRQFNNGDACKNTLNITGGYIYGAKRAVQVHFKNNAAYTTISGGKIEAGAADGYSLCFLTTSENLSVSGGVFIGAVWYSGSKGFISGGTFSSAVDASYCAEGYIPTQIENGYYKVVPGTYVAKNGDKYYVTLEEALDAEGNKVELLVPYVVAAGETKTLDLKGKTITGTPAEAKAYAVITNYGTLTISNGSVICNHTLAGSTGYAVNTITNCGTLTIENGVTIENKSTAQYQIGYAIDNNSTSYDAVVNINGGKVTVSGSLYYDGIRLFCNSETKENSVVVEGGKVSTIWMQNPSDGENKNTKDVKGSITISGGEVGVLSLEPSTNFQAAVTGGHVGEISYFQEAEGRNLVKFITGGTFGMDVTKFCADYHNCTSNENGVYEVKPDANYIAEYIIDDAKGENYTSAEKKVVGTLTYKRTLPNAEKWNPLYVPFAIPMSKLIENYDVAYFNDVRGNDANNDNVVDDGTLKMELVMIDNPDVTLNANYPFVFRAKTEEAKNLELVLDNATLYENTENSVVFTSLDIKCEVKGSYRKCKTGDNQYIVNTNGLWSPLIQDYDLKPYRLILTLSSNNNLKPFAARDIRMFVIGEEAEDGTTHIFDVENDAQTQDSIYDLQGRRVLAPQKGGLYIVNGKKTIIK